MQASDRALLVRWQKSRDANAFNELVGRYAGFVYATSARVLRNATDAEDVTQECFIALAEKPPEKPRSLSAWLHRVATNRALQHIREHQRRQRREERAARDAVVAEDQSWDETSHLVDEAIDKLPDDLRALVVDHYLNRLSHRVIAEHLSVSRQTVSARLVKAVELIRADLRRAGVGVSAAVLVQGFSKEAAAAPQSLLGELGKVAIAGRPARTWLPLRSGLFAKIGLPVGVAAAGLIAFVALRPPGDRPPVPSPAASDAQAAENAAVDTARVEVAAQAERSRTDESLVRVEDDTAVEPERASRTPIPAASGTAPPLKVGEEAPGAIESSSDFVRLSGYIVNEDGVPIPNARITVVATGHFGLEIRPEAFRAFRDPMHQYFTRSDSRGFYEVPGIAYGGNARINVWADGYANANTQFMVEPGVEPIALYITLPRKGLTLKARVLDHTGLPVTDAFVVAPTWRSDSGVSRSVNRFFGRTDDRGRVQMSFAMLGGRFGTEGFAHVLVSSPTAGAGSFERVSLGNDDTIDLRIERSATLRGRIAPQDERGLYATRIVLSEVIDIEGFRDFGYTSTYLAPVDETGAYELQSIPVGRKFTLWVKSELNGDLVPREQLEPFRPGEVRTLNRTAGDGVIISGRVVDARTRRPLPGVRVGHGMSAWEIVDGEQTWTDDDGRYTLVVSDSLDRINLFSTPSFIRESEMQDLAMKSGVRFEVSGRSYEDVEIQLPDLVNLNTYVTDMNGTPLPHAAVLVHGTQLGYTDLDGSLSLLVHATYAGDVEIRKHDYVKRKRGETQTNQLGPGEAELIVALHRAAGGLEGSFIHPNGTAIANAIVEVSGLHESGETFSTDAVSDAEGRFVLLDWCAEGLYSKITIELRHTTVFATHTLENITLPFGEIVVLDPISPA